MVFWRIKKVGKIKYTKALKEYCCLSCNKIICRGINYYSWDYQSPEIIELFTEMMNNHPNYFNAIFESYISLKFCSEDCLLEFRKFRYNKLRGD